MRRLSISMTKVCWTNERQWRRKIRSSWRKREFPNFWLVISFPLYRWQQHNHHHHFCEIEEEEGAESATATTPSNSTYYRSNCIYYNSTRYRSIGSVAAAMVPIIATATRRKKTIGIVSVSIILSLHFRFCVCFYFRCVDNSTIIISSRIREGEGRQSSSSFQAYALASAVSIIPLSLSAVK